MSLTPDELQTQAQAMVNKAVAQRNTFADEVVNLTGQLALKDAEIAKLKEQVETIKAKKAKAT